MFSAALDSPAPRHTGTRTSADAVLLEAGTAAPQSALISALARSGQPGSQPVGAGDQSSDFTDNAVGIIHTTGPKLSKLARKYGPLVPALRALILRPTPAGGRRQGHDRRSTRCRPGAVCRDRASPRRQQRGQAAIRRPARFRLAASRAPATAGSRPARQAHANGPGRGGSVGVAGSGREVPGDRAAWPAAAVPPMPRGRQTYHGLPADLLDGQASAAGGWVMLDVAA